MVFNITIQWSRQIYPLTVVRIKSDRTHEEFKIYNTKNPDKYIVIRNNRPLLLSKGLKKQRWDWDVLEGNIIYRQALAMAIQQIENYLKPQEKPKVKAVGTNRITFNNNKRRRDYYNIDDGKTLADRMKKP